METALAILGKIIWMGLSFVPFLPVVRQLNYPSYQYRLYSNLVYDKKHNVYFCLGKDFSLKVCKCTSFIHGKVAVGHSFGIVESD